jgi:hypothetical protein
MITQPKYLVRRTDGTPIPEDEPCFVIRAKDAFAIRAVQLYIDQVTDVVDENMITELCTHRERIRKWQRDNETKIPD